tara:strand:+ start:388 stop:957 length:570 start_codon:yes stop_codon:yes gene_type:complete
VKILFIASLTINPITFSDIFNTLRSASLTDEGVKCTKRLDKLEVSYKSLGNITDNKCVIKNAVVIKNFPNTKLSSPITVSCSMAEKLEDYFSSINADTVDHLGSYNCRTISNSRVISEHSYGEALDISGINGKSVQKNWNDKDKPFKTAVEKACSIFSNVLTPDTDRAHYNHIHIDNGISFGSLNCFHM